MRWYFFLCLILSYSFSIAQVKPLLKSADSLGKKELNGFKQQINSGRDSLKNGKVFKSAIDQKTTAIQNKFNEKSKALKDKALAVRDSIKKGRAVRFNKLSIENATLVNGIGGSLKKEPILNNISVFGQIQLFKFPLAIDLSNNSSDLQGIDGLRDALFKVNLDKSQFSQLYRNDIEKASRFKKIELSGMDVGAYLKKGITSKLNPSTLIDPSRYQRLNSLLNNKEQLIALLNLNEDQIKAKVNDLLSDQKRFAQKKADSISNNAPDLIAQKDSIKYKADSTVASKKKAVEEQVELKKAEITDVIVSLKQKMEESGLDQQRLLLLQKFTANQGSLKDLEAIFENEMNQEGRYSQIGKFYSKIKALDVGNFGQRMPGIMNKDMMINGVNFAVKTGRGPVNLGLGINKDVGMPKDANFTNSLYDFPKLLTYVSIPTTNFSFGSGKLSWVGAFDKQPASGFSQLNTLPKTNLAFMVSQDLNMHSMGKFTVELSKSSTQYKNLSVNESDKLVLNNDLKMGNYFRDDFMESISIGVKHGIQLKKLGLSGNTFFSYSGLGYQNPGQQGYGNMGMRFGGNMKKSLLKNRIVLNARTDIKNTPMSAVSGAHWRNYNLQLDSRVKLSKNYNFNLKYAENGVNKVDGASHAVYSSKKVQVDMNGNYKIGGHYGFSRLSIGKQDMLNPTLLTHTGFMTIVYSQNLMLKSISLSGNAFYNKELKGARILGDMLNADVACQYTLLKSLSVSSGVTYLDNQGIARQLGVRQNVQLSMLKNFDVSAFVDLRKNLINPLYPDLFSTARGELSLRYFLNK
ncbi:hypothetical protein FBD94_25215 [Pedobacter hiemivivus]|uniref:Uncharacterized protein n=1 Tax=Pedobacter hiemivivus TaxID=2530454 RepID=A0A4U1FWM9_9SPHI|nr:hypothetical protein [Pedobacter hiemivivus]TKC55291.1 hypothetical protein FBD94_25215 [Pedobacter hiemivivus]